MTTSGSRSVLVTGASEGIGFAIASAFAASGARVTIASRDRGKLENAAERLTKMASAPVACFVMDAADENSIEEGWRQLSGEVGRIDVLVNNAGLISPVSDFLEGGDRNLRDSMEVNFWAAVALSRLALPAMKEAGWGRIINTASSAGLASPPGLLPYAVSKAAVIAFTRALAVEYAADGISVNAVAPSAILTDNYASRKTPQECAERAASIPRGSLGAPEDVAAIVAFLASESAGHITGQIISVDGGEIAAGQYTSMFLGRRKGRAA